MSFDARDHARTLRRRLNDHDVDLVVLVREASALFDAVQMRPQTRWLALEQDGYTSSTESRTVHESLGLKATDRLVVQVKTYRVQAGELAEGPQVKFHHFFVESIAELTAARERVRTTVAHGARIRLEFPTPPAHPYVPTAGTFRADVFDRILLGLRASLHLQLAPLAQ